MSGLRVYQDLATPPTWRENLAVQCNPASQHENENERQDCGHYDPWVVPVNAI
jgi:hypothetical protein